MISALEAAKTAGSASREMVDSSCGFAWAGLANDLAIALGKGNRRYPEEKRRGKGEEKRRCGTLLTSTITTSVSEVVHVITFAVIEVILGVVVIVFFFDVVVGPFDVGSYV